MDKFLSLPKQVFKVPKVFRGSALKTFGALVTKASEPAGMPGTDVGSAPQESWHGNTLNPAFLRHKYEPFELAENLQTEIVDSQLQTLQRMRDEGTCFQDWPAIGQFIDQHTFRNEGALAKDG